ncbi:MAG: ATP phosphoribosyltransferase [Candidatus Gastranaerophilales bacterium]|nr:ATP phosphoribosyltransferase [Candidatus Gastranaerophilales bacterium]
MNEIKLAVPNKGRMSEDILTLLSRAGLNLSGERARSLSAKTIDGNYTIIFVRTKDIPKFISEGTVDIGFTGVDVVEEFGAEVDELLKLDFGHCEMVVASKEESDINSVNDVENGMKVATSFPNIARKFFEKSGKKVQITEVSGATEITPRLGLADIVVDITSTGSTLKVNKLKIIEKILKSQAVIIGRKGIKQDRKNEVEAFVRAIISAIAAQEKKYLMAHVPKNKLDKVREFLPGMASPTITTLLGNDKDVVMHVVVDKNSVYESVDRLKQLGGSSILIMTVDQIIK